jgi:uncharacterized protein with HEPN domain
MRQSDNLRLKHMLDTERKVIEFSTGHSRADLNTNQILASALIREVCVIGEAAASISIGEREQLVGIPWKSIIGMRNRLVHAYDRVDLDILWDTIVNDIPQLIGELERLPEVR